MKKENVCIGSNFCSKRVCLQIVEEKNMTGTSWRREIIGLVSKPRGREGGRERGRKEEGEEASKQTRKEGGREEWNKERTKEDRKEENGAGNDGWT